jgi:coatomer protein complex subunit alpha (xenin)
LNNSIVKELEIKSKDGNNVRINNIFHAGGKNILVATNNSVILYDTENRQVVEELYCVGVRQIVWNSDYSALALLSNKS